ncbi:sporulation-specific protein 15 [Punica granatum]|uniref:Sporulation-specific protein 15 n=1 Tax=Punica granatum TaxID=22663 RepID=A0A6P8E3D6_PUNGR|nr:sporulation-specific protein 15 [Punica granatum]
MPEMDAAADSQADDSSSPVNGSAHFESGAADTDASVNQVADMEDEKSDYQDDGKVGDDAGKDEFVDASEELNADNRDLAVVPESEAALDERSSSDHNSSGRVENGEADHDLMDEIRRLQDLLDKAVSEKESASRDYEEERERYTREISELCHQIKGLTYQRQVVENGDVYADHHDAAESGDGKEKLEGSVTSFHDMIRECSKLIRDALEERSQMEGSVRELHTTLQTKDQQIEDVTSKIAELSANHDIQIEKDQHLEFVTRRLLDSLAFVAEHEALVDNSVGKRLDLVERRTGALIEKYSEIYYQIDQLRQYLPDAGSELLPDEIGNVVSGACSELHEAKRKEADLVEKIRMAEVENGKLVEQLEKDKVALEASNEELGQVRAELEQEKMRLGNVKEKLSMAVTKGKSLVHQRDSLKQSLAERTSELERFTMDLQEKSSALEAAEATIEELRQNESLIALLQENLSQRNAILIKFEEFLSETSLPEEIRPLDITEKYRWLIDERNALRDIVVEYQKCKDALSLLELPESVSNSDCGAVVFWLKESFSQAKTEVETLQAEIARTKESAQNEIDRFSSSLSAVLQEKDYLQSELDDLKLKYEEIVEKQNEDSSEKERMAMLLVEKSGLAASDLGYEEISFSDYVMLVDRCFEKLRENTISPYCSPAELELFEKIKNLLYVRDLELMLCEKVLEEEMLARSEEVNNMSNELKVMSVELFALKEERGSLQKDLERSEEKSAMLREKLSLAVKKGKGLVQDRENLRHLLDQKNGEIEKLKLEIQQQESAVSDCKDEISRMSSLVEGIPVLENDLTSVKEQKDDLQQSLLESNNMLQRMMESVESIEVPPDLVAEEPAEKIKWLAATIIECRTAKDSVEQELGRALEEAGNLTGKLAETVAAVEKMQMIEEDFEKVKQEASNLTSQLREAQETIKTLEDELSAAQNSISELAEERREIEVAKMNIERDLQEALRDASSQASSYAEAYAMRKSLEDALSQAESNISVLLNEKEAAQASRGDVEMEREKMKEEISVQNNKLGEAHATIKSLEELVSKLHASVAALSEDRATLEDELKKIQDETGSKDSSLTDAFANINSLEGTLSKTADHISVLENENKIASQEISELKSKLTDAFANIESLEGSLSEAENHISVIENENKIANQEISELKSKLNACLEELAGKSGSIESRSLELVGHLDQLEVLLKDESLFSMVKKDFGKKIERLKDMDTILNSMKSQLSSTHSEQVEYEQGGSVSDQLLPGDFGDAMKVDVESSPMNAVDGGNISLSFIRSVEGFHRKNKILADKFMEFSAFIDETLAVLFRKLEGRRDEITSMVEDMESLKRDLENTEAHKMEQESAMSMLDDAATFLLSACADITKELQFEAENNLLSLVSVSELETRGAGGIDAGEYRKKLDGSKYIEPVEDLLLAVGRAKGVMKQFEEASKAAATKIENLENKLNEAQAVSVKALDEVESKHNIIYKLEKDVEVLENLCSSLKLKVEDYQANIEKLKEKEAEYYSMYSELLLKQQEAEDALLSPSQWRALADKIIGIEISVADISGRDPVSNGSHAEKLFYIIDRFGQLQNQVDLLMLDKEELQSNLAAKVLEIKHLKEEVELQSRHTQHSEKTKNDLSELIFGLEKMASMLGVNEMAGEQKRAEANALLAALEKQMMNVISECEASKSRAQELGTKLLGSQKVIDELSTKVKFLEGSLQGRSLQPEVIQERGIFEATSVPPGSEISEIEDVDSAGNSLISPAPSAAHVRTMRKGSTDHLALNIDAESQHLINAETDDNKGHKFKSLNTSGLIPKQGKLVADRIDGICVNGGRILMTRPGARLGLIAYWLFLHIWLLGTLL